MGGELVQKILPSGVNILPRDPFLATVTSFMSYFVMSAIISPLGIVSGSISAQYEISLPAATALFSYLTTGVLVGSLLSIVANPALGSRIVTLVSSVALAITIVLLRVIDSAEFLPVAFVLIGASCGLLLATAAIVLTAIYSERHRPSALLATDSCYSFAGFVATPLAGFVVAQAMHWTYAYGFALIMTIVIGVISYCVKYPPEMKAAEEARKEEARWPVSVFLIGAALIVYLISFIFVYSWTPAYATEAFGLEPSAAGLLVSQFFLGLFFGQIVMFFAALRIDVRILIGAIGAAATMVTAGLWLSESASQLGLSLFALGFATGGLLKPVIAYGTQVLAHPTSRLVAFYMLCAAIGSSISPAFGAYLVNSSSIKSLLYGTTIGFAATYALLVMSFFASRRHFNSASSSSS